MEIRKRKRAAGPFPCPYPGCGKTFSRSDHLSRHSASHSPDNKFICSWPSCGRSFSRTDVKKKHESRHLANENKTNAKSAIGTTKRSESATLINNKDPSRGSSSSTDPETTNRETKPSSDGHNIFIREHRNGLQTSFSVSELRSNISTDHLQSATLNNFRGNNDRTNRPINITNSQIQQPATSSLMSILSTSPSTSPISNNIHAEEVSQLKNELSNHQQVGERKQPTTTAEAAAAASTSGMLMPSSAPLSPSNLIRWLLQDSANVSPTSGRRSAVPENGGFHDGTLGSTTVAMLEEIFALTPEFPTANYQTDVDDTLTLEMIRFIPSLKDSPDFEPLRIKWFLELYWLLYHSQYPILHRPSFSTFQVHPLLLLSMITIGASFAKRVNSPDRLQLVDPNGLADKIADPLRWLIFSCEQAKPPCKAWVIQSLLILETYEITCTSRSLHERACIYNGAKIQLLRRSPILGGDPLKSVETDSSQSNSLWKTWIESESMKRVAWMSFYIDTIHAVVYGHPVNLYASQIKLSLPCPDDFWEYDNVDRNKAPSSLSRMPIFSDALRSLLQMEPVVTGPFGRKILLAGLLNLILQMEQKVSQSSLLGWESIEESWQDTIASALDFWKAELPDGNCCLTVSCIYHLDINSTALPPSFRIEDTRCSFPEYHAAQIYLRITHYDYIVYAGAPRRMNVPILPEDYDIVERRIKKWAMSPGGPICVVHSFILLFEMFLSPEDSMECVNYEYKPDADPFMYRPNVVISAILSLWSYCFYMYGPESFFNSTHSSYQLRGDFVPAMEDASSYLRRIRSQFKEWTGKSLSSLNSMDSRSYNMAIKEYAYYLGEIKNLNNLVGLLSALSKGYRDCRWDTGREYSKLLDNCVQRSMGSENIFCVDMYEIN